MIGNDQIAIAYMVRGFTAHAFRGDNALAEPVTDELSSSGRNTVSKKIKRVSKRRVTLREESFAESKLLGLDQMQAQMDAIFSVLHEHGINTRLWLEEYLAACEKNDWNAPADFQSFLPWNLSPQAKARLSKDSFFSYGDAHFMQSTDGTVYHLQKNGTRVKISIGDLTAEEFEALTGLQ